MINEVDHQLSKVIADSKSYRNMDASVLYIAYRITKDRTIQRTGLTSMNVTGGVIAMERYPSPFENRSS